MSTPLILVSGGCIGLGIVILLWRLVPTTPDLGAAMKTFGGTDRRYSDTTATGQQAQIESWFYTHMPAALLAHMPTRNLDIVGTSYAAHLTKKVTVAGALLIAPIFVSAALWVIGTPLPLVTVLSLPLALLGWFIPDLDLAQQAAKAREEFHLTVATYVELTGMAAKSGLSPSQALEVAAESGNSWVFERLQNANLRSRFASEQPWVGLTRLAKDSDVPELTELRRHHEGRCRAGVDRLRIVASQRPDAAPGNSQPGIDRCERSHREDDDSDDSARHCLRPHSRGAVADESFEHLMSDPPRQLRLHR